MRRAGDMTVVDCRLLSACMSMWDSVSTESSISLSVCLSVVILLVQTLLAASSRAVRSHSSSSQPTRMARLPITAVVTMDLPFPR